MLYTIASICDSLRGDRLDIVEVHRYGSDQWVLLQDYVRVLLLDADVSRCFELLTIDLEGCASALVWVARSNVDHTIDRALLALED